MLFLSSKKSLKGFLFDRVLVSKIYRQSFATFSTSTITCKSDDNTNSSDSSITPAYTFSKTNKPARVVRLLSEHGGAALRPLIQGKRYSFQQYKLYLHA